MLVIRGHDITFLDSFIVRSISCGLSVWFVMPIHFVVVVITTAHCPVIVIRQVVRVLLTPQSGSRSPIVATTVSKTRCTDRRGHSDDSLIPNSRFTQIPHSAESANTIFVGHCGVRRAMHYRYDSHCVLPFTWV
jgi:hypothetical protein